MTNPVQVLYVDDDPRLGELVPELLQQENDRFEVYPVTEATEGLNCLRSDDQQIDCIVSDYEMPNMDGIEFLESVRDMDSDLPFILYTGKGSEGIASDAITAGATDYLQKRAGTDQYTVLANRIQNAVDQYRTQQRVEEHQRITSVIRDLNRALVYADSVDEIEQEVCAILSDADPYVTACIADVNTNIMQIEPRVWAGDAAGYFAGLDMSVDEGSPGRHAPGGRAYHEREVAISQNISEDPQYEQWREAATERGFQSLAVVPLEYGEELYGLLAVFADRQYAFDETEQELLTELGDDIAHAVHAQEAQSALRTRNRAIDEAPVGITVSDPDKTDNPMVYVNNEFTAVSEYAEAELLGENHRILQGPRTEDEPVVGMREGIDNEERVTVELRNYRKSGELFWNRVSIAPVYDSEGRLTNYVGFQEDITDRKEYEQELQQNERRFEALLNDPNLLVGLIETDGTVLDVNGTAMEYVNAERSAVVGDKFWRTPWWSDEMQPVIRDKIEQAATGEYIEYEADLEKPDGDQYSVTGVIRPVTDKRGEVTSLIVSARDVTDRVNRERILDAILENTRVPMFLKNRASEYLLINQGFRDLFGLEDTDVHGQTDADLFGSEMATELQQNDSRVLETGELVETEEKIVFDGEELTFLSSKTPIYDIGTESDPDDPIAVFGIAKDITERRRRQQELELKDSVISAAPIGIVITDPSQEDSSVIFANDGFVDLTGYSREEILGRNCRFLQGEATDSKRVAKMRDAIEDQQPVTVELRNYRKDGTQFWNRVTIAPVRDEDGEVTNHVGFQEDVTERKRRDRQLSALDRVLRHNLRNGLNVVLMASETIQNQVDDPTITTYADQIIQSTSNLLENAEKQRRIVSLLSETPDRIVVAISDVVDRCAEQVSQRFPDAEIVVSGEKDTRAVTIPQFDQAVTELVENAIIHAESETPVVTVDIEMTGDGTRLSVTDTGPPISDSDRAILRGDSEEEALIHGSGMGLWLVNWIINYSDGRITYAENEPRGNIIQILLPQQNSN